MSGGLVWGGWLSVRAGARGAGGGRVGGLGGRAGAVGSLCVWWAVGVCAHPAWCGVRVAGGAGGGGRAAGVARDPVQGRGLLCWRQPTRTARDRPGSILSVVTITAPRRYAAVAVARTVTSDAPKRQALSSSQPAETVPSIAPSRARNGDAITYRPDDSTLGDNRGLFSSQRRGDPLITARRPADMVGLAVVRHDRESAAEQWVLYFWPRPRRRRTDRFCAG